MRKSARVACLLALTVASMSGCAGQEYQQYRNDRYGFTVEGPGSFVRGDPPADGDGAVFTSPDGRTQVMVRGSDNV